ncbi:leukocyte surface antigen CD53-like [Siniperca chuatsi]|uniref:leukocyte surface antigen CD53-like n=1 Tax=Siniperca chuatsi TaxID=119488 RepID=UPI001CE1EC0D|nr:leukocyte surface antigen CD53-like [Siniperca chuatsi]
MGQLVNPCLKRVFTIFNIFFAFIGGVIIALALLSQFMTSFDGGDSLEGRTSGLTIFYVVGSITMVIAILGAYGAHKESRVCLSVFLMCMVVGCSLMLRTGIPAASARPKLEGFLENKFREFLPLDKATDDVKAIADNVQTQLHCCGLFSYKDWEGNIPNSCLCTQDVETDGKCQTIKYLEYFTTQSKSIYVKTCFPIISHYALLMADIVIGVILTLAILALLGMILSSVMIHQIRYSNRPTVLLSVPAIFTTVSPKYQELHNPPKYQEMHNPPQYQEMHNPPKYQELHNTPAC